MTMQRVPEEHIDTFLYPDKAEDKVVLTAEEVVFVGRCDSKVKMNGFKSKTMRKKSIFYAIATCSPALHNH